MESMAPILSRMVLAQKMPVPRHGGCVVVLKPVMWKLGVHPHTLSISYGRN
jgi:hypothetical protein